jgi:hypothetical protein
MLNWVVHDQGGRSQIPMHVRFAPKAAVGDQSVIRHFVPQAAVSNRSKAAAYSMTSSARASTVAGTSRPIAIAKGRGCADQH